MPGLPSHLFVVRHGNRLDAADKKWHLTSPTPYDPPLTYGGFLQSRQVGNQIGTILESAKIEDEAAAESASPDRRGKRFKVVVHSSPFLRCVQTSIGIASGLAQAAADSLYSPRDVIVPAVASHGTPSQIKTAVLRLDSFLGEWLSPEYFENITPPPGPALMLGGAKADLLRREDYSRYAESNSRVVTPSAGALWSASPSSASESDGGPNSSSMATVLQRQSEAKKGYNAPKPTYAASTSGKIPDGFVAHARDACAAVDYQWDSMREPLDFGDGGKLGEEWTAMHKRFRRGIKRMLNWYASTEDAAEMVTTPVVNQGDSPVEPEDVETVVVIVSHGAGCNALIGAITHQPVLMDVAIASLTMAMRKPGLDDTKLLRVSGSSDPSSLPSAAVHEMYDIRVSASTEHLHSSSSTPVSRSSSVSHALNNGARGRTSTFGSNPTAPPMNPFSYMDSLGSPGGSRSTSASATLEKATRRNTPPPRPSSRALAFATGNAGSRSNSPPPAGSSNAAPSLGLWAPMPSSLRLMDDNGSDTGSEDFPNFDQSRFKEAAPGGAPPPSSVPLSAVAETGPVFESPRPGEAPIQATEVPQARGTADGPTLSGPIKLNTNLSSQKPAEEVGMTTLGDGLGGLWSLPQPPGEAERYRDLSHAKRRWTVNERA